MQSSAVPVSSAPEVWAGESACEQSDVWMLGICYIELLLGGRSVFEDVDELLPLLCSAEISGWLLVWLPADVPVWLREVVTGCLPDRWTSDAVVEHLERHRPVSKQQLLL